MNEKVYFHPIILIWIIAILRYGHADEKHVLLLMEHFPYQILLSLEFLQRSELGPLLTLI